MRPWTLLALVACEAEPTTVELDPGICLEITVDDLGGPYDQRTVTVVDAEGRIRAETNGGYHEDWRWEDDRLVERTWYFGDDVAWDRGRVRYTWDDAEEWLLEVAEDRGDDGTVEERTTYAWADGRLDEEVRLQGDDVVSTTRYTWDDDGRLQVRRLRYPDRPPFTWSYTWSGDDLASETYEDPATGPGPERITAWTWDADGHELTESLDDARWDGSGGADGRADELRTSTWSDGLLTLEVAERPVGTPVRQWTREHDDQGREVHAEERPIVDGVVGEPDRVWETTYADVACPAP